MSSPPTTTPRSGSSPGSRPTSTAASAPSGSCPASRTAPTLYLGIGRPSGPAFEGLKLAPGEVRDLGDLRFKPRGTKP